ncbi:MAG: DnaA regulatory inactivator Hda [Candidatus Azotimanducaceae bacterium]|uniref:DnaA regulatory inactivator Hda n=1 Tax=OM182 bacterium TaxID=2510334 RepID=A0A520S196_9GAMM|nr:MAG: DnaA regulatory inactivator Hda [OM182 bacterium]
MTGQLALKFPLTSDATFGNYIGHAASKIRTLKTLAYLWGPTQSGRSHLLQALCHEANDNKRSAIYLESLWEYEAELFNGLESMSVIAVDDIDTVIGASDWELALFHLINAVSDKQGLLVVSAKVPANQLAVDLNDLRSRLSSAVAVHTDWLSDQEKLQALQKRAKFRGFTLDDDVGHFLLDRVPRNMGSLMEVLGRIELETLNQQRKATIPLVKRMLGL